jgi:hypothetical protein
MFYGMAVTRVFTLRGRQMSKSRRYPTLKRFQTIAYNQCDVSRWRGFSISLWNDGQAKPSAQFVGSSGCSPKMERYGNEDFIYGVNLFVSGYMHPLVEILSGHRAWTNAKVER